MTLGSPSHSPVPHTSQHSPLPPGRSTPPPYSRPPACLLGSGARRVAELRDGSGRTTCVSWAALPQGRSIHSRDAGSLETASLGPLLIYPPSTVSMAPPPSSRPLPRAEPSSSRPAGRWGTAGGVRGAGLVRPFQGLRARGCNPPTLSLARPPAAVPLPQPLPYWLAPAIGPPLRLPWRRAAPGPAGWRGGGARGAGKVAELLCTLRSCSCDGSFPPPSWLGGSERTPTRHHRYLPSPLRPQPGLGSIPAPHPPGAQVSSGVGLGAGGGRTLPPRCAAVGWGGSVGLGGPSRLWAEALLHFAKLSGCAGVVRRPCALQREAGSQNRNQTVSHSLPQGALQGGGGWAARGTQLGAEVTNRCSKTHVTGRDRAQVVGVGWGGGGLSPGPLRCQTPGAPLPPQRRE
jgi:hypothetical protein